MKQATILTEDFAGMKSQAVGFAKRAGFEPNFCNVTPKLPWSLFSAPYWPFPLRSVLPFERPQSQAVISVGSVGGVINAALRQKDRPAIHIQNPRIPVKKFDLVIVNPHDELTGENVLISRTALHHVSPQLLMESKEKWQPFFQSYKKPLVAVLIGGNNGRFTLGKAEAEQISSQLMHLIKNDHVGIALTPSRRTDPEAVQIFKDRLLPLGAYVWDGIEENPYLGLLACADMILVTIDSVSMISEAVATSTPVMTLSLPGKSKRIFSFINSIKKEKRIKPFEGQFKPWFVRPMDDTDDIINQAKRRLGF